MTGPMAMRDACLVLPLLSACWTGEVSIKDPVWSDDDEMIGFVASSSEWRATYEGDSYRVRDHGSQVYVMPADLSESPEPVFDGVVLAESLYVMSGAGYVLAELQFSDGEQPQTWQHFLDDGSSRRIGDTDDWPAPSLPEPRDSRSTDAVPSADGSLIALQEHHGQRGHGEILSILDAYSLDVVFGPVSLPFGSVSWAADDALLWRRYDEGGVVELLGWTRSSGRLVPVSDPGCTGPATTSSQVAEDGRWLEPQSSLEEPIEILDAPPNVYAPPGFDGSERPYHCP